MHLGNGRFLKHCVMKMSVILGFENQKLRRDEYGKRFLIGYNIAGFGHEQNIYGLRHGKLG